MIEKIRTTRMVQVLPDLKVPVERHGWMLRAGKWTVIVVRTQKPVIPEAFRDPDPGQPDNWPGVREAFGECPAAKNKFRQRADWQECTCGTCP
jgi:hypothetical protein